MPLPEHHREPLSAFLQATASARYSQRPPLVSRQAWLRLLTHRSQVLPLLFQRGWQPEYRKSNLVSRLRASEQVPPSGHLMREPLQLRLLRLERESPQGCRSLIQASQPEPPSVQRVQKPEPTLRSESQELQRQVRARRCSRRISPLESWPESRPLTILVQT